MNTTLVTLVILTGVVTRYDAEPTDPLKCGGEYGTVSGPWIALDIRGLGWLWECRVTAMLLIDGYPPMQVTVLDSGRFGRHCVRQLDGSCPPIVGDLPTRHAPFAPDLSARGTVVILEPPTWGFLATH